MNVVGSGSIKARFILIKNHINIHRSSVKIKMVFDDIACENLNHLNPPTMDLVDIIRLMNEKFNVNSLSEEELHGLIEGGLQEAYKKGWMIPVYINPGKKEKSGWVRKNSPVQLPTEVFVNLKKMNKQCKKISTKMLDKNFACIRKHTRPDRIPTSKLKRCI